MMTLPTRLPWPVRMVLPSASRPTATAPVPAAAATASVTPPISNRQTDRGQERVPVSAEPADRARHVRRELRHDLGEAAGLLRRLQRPAQGIADLSLIRLRLARPFFRIV